jgi:hypothetical protein
MNMLRDSSSPWVALQSVAIGLTNFNFVPQVLLISHITLLTLVIFACINIAGEYPSSADLMFS